MRLNDIWPGVTYNLQINLNYPLLADLGPTGPLVSARYDTHLKKKLFLFALNSYNCGCPLQCLSSLLSNDSTIGASTTWFGRL